MMPVSAADSPSVRHRRAATSDAEKVRPVRLSNAQEYRLGDELLVYVPGRETAYTLNRSAVAIWDLCDSTKTVAEIGRALAQCLGRSEDALLPDVIDGLRELHESGLVELG